MKRFLIVISFLFISLIFFNISLILKPVLAVDNDESLANLMAGTCRSKDIGNHPIKIESHNKQVIAKLLPIYWDNKVGMTKEMPLLNGVVCGGNFIGTYYHLHFGGSWGVKIYCIENLNSKIVISSDGKIFEMVLVPGEGPVKFIKD